MRTARRSATVLRHRSALLAATLGAVLLAGAAPATAQPKPAPAASADADAKKALDLFKKAQGLYKQDKFAEALPLFRESYGLVPSPNSRIYIARCLARTNARVAAYQEFEALIADVDARKDPKYQQTRDAAVTERDELAAKLSLFTINVSNAKSDTRVTIGGVEVPRDGWGKPTPFEPGSVEVAISPPIPPTTQRVELRAGEKRSLDLDASPATTGGQPPGGGGGTGGGTSSRAVLRPVSYALGGVGVLGFAAFGVAGGLATSNYDALNKDCAQGTGVRACPAGSQSKIDEGKLEKDIANIGLIVGAVGLAAGVTLFVVSSVGKKDEAPKTEVQAVIGPSYLGVQGSF